VTNQYQIKKKNNGNIFPPPQLQEIGYKINEYIGNKLKNNNNISFPSQTIENSNLVEVNNKLNIPSSSALLLILFLVPLLVLSLVVLSLSSSNLRYSVGGLTVADLDSNNEDAIDRLLKVRDNIPKQGDANSVINALLVQLNTKRY
jgi:hypothetical protein